MICSPESRRLPGLARLVAPPLRRKPLPSLMLKSHFLRWIIWLPLLAAGCSREMDGITQYKAPKEVAAAKPQVPSAPSAGWFVKLTGPANDLAPQLASFVQFVSKFKITANGEPQWQLPPGWKQVPPGELDPALAQARFATLRIEETKPPLDVTVTTLPSSDPTSEAYIQQNFNRWRTQVGLAPLQGPDWIAKARESGELSIFGTEDGFLVFVKLTGPGPKSEAAESESDAASPEVSTYAALVPFVPGGMERVRPEEPPEPPTAPAAPPFQFTAPEGWTPTSKPLASVAFTRTDGEKTADLTVIRLSGGGSFGANVNRWRGQIGLEPVDEKEIESQPLEVAGSSARLVELQGEKDALLTVIIPQDRVQWFVKLMGDKDLVLKERDAFLKFVQSIKFE